MCRAKSDPRGYYRCSGDMRRAGASAAANLRAPRTGSASARYRSTSAALARALVHRDRLTGRLEAGAGRATGDIRATIADLDAAIEEATEALAGMESASQIESVTSAPALRSLSGPARDAMRRRDAARATYEQARAAEEATYQEALTASARQAAERRRKRADRVRAHRLVLEGLTDRFPDVEQVSWRVERGPDGALGVVIENLPTSVPLVHAVTWATAAENLQRLRAAQDRDLAEAHTAESRARLVARREHASRVDAARRAVESADRSLAVATATHRGSLDEAKVTAPLVGPRTVAALDREAAGFGGFREVARFAAQSDADLTARGVPAHARVGLTATCVRGGQRVTLARRSSGWGVLRIEDVSQPAQPGRVEPVELRDVERLWEEEAA